MSEIALPAGALPEAITIGPDGHIWFRERSSNRIGRATLLPPPTEPSLTLQLNAASFGPGDTMTVVATLIPGPAPALVDAYIVQRRPDGALPPTAAADRLCVAGARPAARIDPGSKRSRHGDTKPER